MKFLTTALLLSTLLASSLSAAPAWKKKLTNGRPGPYLKLKQPLITTYTLSWNGTLNAGEATLHLGQLNPKYPQYHITQATGRSRGLAATLFPYAFSYTAFLYRNNYLPHSSVGSEASKKGKKTTQNNYTNRRVLSVEKKNSRKTGLTKTETKHYSGKAYDLISAILFIRSLDLKPGQSQTLVVHPFQTPYLATITVLGREKHRGRNALKIDLKLRKINPDLTLKTYKKMRTAVLWLSDDADRLPLELRAKVFIGDVRCELTRIKRL